MSDAFKKEKATLPTTSPPCTTSNLAFFSTCAFVFNYFAYFVRREYYKSLSYSGVSASMRALYLKSQDGDVTSTRLCFGEFSKS